VNASRLSDGRCSRRRHRVCQQAQDDGAVDGRRVQNKDSVSTLSYSNFVRTRPPLSLIYTFIRHEDRIGLQQRLKQTNR